MWCKRILKFIVKMLQNILKTFTSFGSTKMVLIIRTDLNMGRGKIASQAAHASILLYKSSLETSNPSLKTWLRYGQPKIVLKVDNEDILRDLYDKALGANLNACVVCDAGRTQVETGTLTAVGIGPGATETIDKITNGLKLL